MMAGWTAGMRALRRLAAGVVVSVLVLSDTRVFTGLEAGVLEGRRW